MTAAPLGAYAASFCPDGGLLAMAASVRRGLRVESDAGDQPPRWTVRDVARELNRHRARIYEIPRDELPYQETEGGTQRQGRRYYRREDVEAYRRRRDNPEGWRMEVERRLTEHDAELAALRADVADLRALRTEQRPPAE